MECLRSTIIVIYYSSFTLYVFIVVHSWTLLDHTRSVDTADGRNWWLETHASEHNDCSVFTLLY